MSSTFLKAVSFFQPRLCYCWTRRPLWLNLRGVGSCMFGFFPSGFLSWVSEVAEQLLGVMQVAAAVALWVMHGPWKHPCVAPTSCFPLGHLFHLHLSQCSAHTFQTERPHPCGAVYSQWWTIRVFFFPSLWRLGKMEKHFLMIQCNG